MLTARVSRRHCIGSANCVAIAPDVFELDLFGKARVRPEGDAVADEPRLWEAARNCPVEAIILLRDGQQVFPE